MTIQSAISAATAYCDFRSKTNPGDVLPPDALPTEALPTEVLPPDAVQLRESHGVRRRCGRREALFQQGDPATHIFRLKDGAVALEQFLEDGRRQLVELLLPSDVCGLSSGGCYTATAIALVPTTFQVCSVAEIERQPWLGWEIVHQFEAQLCAAHEHVLALGRMAAQERVCSLLVRLARLSAQASESPAGAKMPIAIRLPLTRGEMGDYLGLSLETVCRVMSGLERRGIIEIGRRHGDVIINDLARLEHMFG